MADRRVPIKVDGLGHGANPIPLAVRVGASLISSALNGTDRHQRRLPESYEDQVECLFDNIQAVLDAGGATPEQIVDVEIFLAPGLDRSVINGRWVKMFPDPEDRPVRHTVVLAPANPGVHIQAKFTAQLS
jgi:2-iminobutanoate/2-iminopropanoate deaminase